MKQNLLKLLAVAVLVLHKAHAQESVEEFLKQWPRIPIFGVLFLGEPEAQGKGPLVDQG